MKHYPLSSFHIERALTYPDNYGRIGWFAYLLDTFVPKQHTVESATTIASDIFALNAHLSNRWWTTPLVETINSYYNALIRLGYTNHISTIYTSSKGYVSPLNKDD